MSQNHNWCHRKKYLSEHNGRFDLSPFCDFSGTKVKEKGSIFFFVTGMCKSAANGRIRNTVFLNKLNSLVHPKNERFELDRLIDYVYND